MRRAAHLQQLGEAPHVGDVAHCAGDGRPEELRHLLERKAGFLTNSRQQRCDHRLCLHLEIGEALGDGDRVHEASGASQWERPTCAVVEPVDVEGVPTFGTLD